MVGRGESDVFVTPGDNRPSSAGRPEPARLAPQDSFPTITVPKGGEKFQVNAATGTASLSVPLAVTPGRAGFGPALALSYDSGAGNGPFGLGWGLQLPAIARNTAKGLPRYRDADDTDVFVLSGEE